MNTKGIVSLLVALILITAVIIFQKFQGPDLSHYLPLKEPAFCTLPPQRVLQVEAKGSPEAAGKKAFGLLMKTYFGLKGVPKGGPDFKAPRARWPLPASVPQTEWIGIYAMPIPDSVKVMKGPASSPGLTAALTTWEYGEVAQILHVGPYEKEEPAIKRLHNFIRDNGYVINGAHEEEYLKGPGMFFKGNPATYYTIIRYQVKKADSAGIVPR